MAAPKVDRCELTLVIGINQTNCTRAPCERGAVVLATRVACEPVARAVNTPLPRVVPHITKIDGDRLTTICSNLIFKGAFAVVPWFRIVIPFH